MEITVQEQGAGRAVLRPEGRLDLVSAAALRGAVADEVTAGRTLLVVDLAAVPFVDSSGLGALIAALKQARKAGGELRIAAAAAPILEVLALMRLDRVLRPYETVAAALEDL
jgi:anti-sigma B factor antagonist